jgi:4-hydroxy-3-polyprenylbenzoate decarboxylase
VLKAMPDVQTHVTVSGAGLLTLRHEMNMDRAHVEELADVTHAAHDVGAQIASGSFQCDGMVIAPCSMRSLAAVAMGLSDNLVTRAADVMLKERRRLVLMVRETPLNLAHLRNMTTVTEMGGIIFPPVPSFYHHPASVDELVNQTVNRVLDVLGLPQSDVQRWGGLPQEDRPLPALT